ncbi:MAG: winged helix-turn-helix domain-containing protein [Gemmatimonadetes bacterium]|nr:winged helix-turn-helix domain-containing protein [Gemmatimonadota bacterium]
MLRINVLGGLYVTRDGRPVTGAAGQPRRLALLALLAIAGDRGVTRDALLAYLWPDSDEERGRRALTQALYALRRDLGSDEAVAGMKDLRLNPDLVTCDVAEFRDALAAEADERAVELWRGPFLEGFHLPGADTFERWVEEQRTGLHLEYTDLLDRLADRAMASDDPRTAAGWLRKLAATDPLNGQIAARLMRALAAQGDVAGALQHARVYETLLRQELELPPDREVVTLANELRRGGDPPATRVPAVASTPTPVAVAGMASPPAPAVAAPPDREAGIHETSGWAAMARATAQPLTPVPPRETADGARLAVRIATVVVLLLAAAAVYYGWTVFRRPVEPRAGAAAPLERVVAVGRITHYATGGSGPLGEPLADMLATNLARATGLRVVSNARMVEVQQQLGRASDSAGTAMAAARQAGATELLDGALYDVAPGQLRLDLRRVDLASGDVRKAYTVAGANLFALADSGTAALLADLGVGGTPGSIRDVSTSSLAAYQAYEAGLRLFFAGNVPAAEQRFQAALAADSTFAMAAFYYALAATAPNAGGPSPRMELAVRLADRASDRERLLIHAQWAFINSSSRLSAIAETLTVRYPDELGGYDYLGQGANLAGNYPAAVGAFREVIRRDSLGLSGRVARCLACQAYPALAYAYGAMDSLPQAIRVMQEWSRAQPTRALPLRTLAGLEAMTGNVPAAERAMVLADQLEPGSAALQGMHADVLLLSWRYAEAERLLRAEVETGPAERRREALWELAVALRQQGRFTEALDVLRRYRRERNEVPNRGAAPNSAQQEAQVLFELGRYREAAALFDSAGHFRPVPSLDSSAVARALVWAGTHRATVYAAAGDTARLPGLADSLQAQGRISGFGRDRLLHAYVRGLLALARGDDGRGATYLREAIFSPNFGYSRINYELAGAYLRLHRPADAVGILRATLRSGLTGSNLYLTRTEAIERLAQAFETAGQRDSAALYYRRVADAWAQADAPLRARREAARLKATELGSLR